ncbi:hypothetical protein V6N11_052379 [Hibiscus sabdariffa]|uniref:Sugar phosphate transporter domain-containing protein n=1 Tax=Hibiscus sabdariffa TaxID=183260 RepID=A0ABR2UAK4_9ROSI
MADPVKKKMLKEEFVTYAYIILYIALSSGQIFFNKWVLSSKEINFPYPLGLTLLHMLFSSVLCFLLTKGFKVLKVEEGMTLEITHAIQLTPILFYHWKISNERQLLQFYVSEDAGKWRTKIYTTSVVPIGAMFAMTLWLGNTAYLYISVAFAQMLKAIKEHPLLQFVGPLLDFEVKQNPVGDNVKEWCELLISLTVRTALVPVAVFILGVAAGLEIMSCRMLLIMSVISFGVLVASYGEINISWIGVVYQMGGVVGEALRLIFMEILVKRKGLKLNPISLMYYVSPCSALCLFIPWLFLEKPKMDAHGMWNLQPVVLMLNSLCTFALNLSVFLVISHTSALTIRVAGVVKDWVVVLVSALLFADTKLTVINILGYGIAIAGVAAYNNHKLKREASRNISDNSQDAPTIPMTTSSNPNR